MGGGAKKKNETHCGRRGKKKDPGGKGKAPTEKKKKGLGGAQQTDRRTTKAGFLNKRNIYEKMESGGKGVLQGTPGGVKEQKKAALPASKPPSTGFWGKSFGGEEEI